MRKVLGIIALIGAVASLAGCDFLVCLNNFPPTAVISASPLSGEAPLTVHFSGSASNDYGDYLGRIVKYSWDFGDGAKSTEVRPLHTYDKPGTYTVVLKVTDQCQVTDTATAIIQVIPANQAPIARIAAEPTEGPPPLEVSFDGSASLDLDGVIIRYDWDFGDGTKSSGVTVTHIYERAQAYDVVLRVTDEDGAAAEATVRITVTAPSA